MYDESYQGNTRAKKAIRIAIGKYLKELRVDTQPYHTQVGLANLMGVHQSTIQRVESGQNAPSHGLIVLYMRFLDLDIGEFYDMLNIVMYNVGGSGYDTPSGYRRRQAGKR